MSQTSNLKILQQKIWQSSIVIKIRLSPTESRTYNDTEPYLIRVPRLSYLPFLLPRIHNFFSSVLIDPTCAPNNGWFSFEDVPLKWQYPIGLLFDLFAGVEPVDFANISRGNDFQEHAIPWELQIHFTEWPHDQLIPLDTDFKNHHDAFMNSVKEADFLRNGTAKAIMTLGMAESTGLWKSVQQHDLVYFNSVNQKLLKPPGSAIRHVPVKIYLPSPSNNPHVFGRPVQGTLRVVQPLITPTIPPHELQTIGNALHNLLPSIFPSRRSSIHAQAVLHGAILPLAAPLQDLMHGATYADGFLHIAIIMVS